MFFPVSCVSRVLPTYKEKQERLCGDTYTWHQTRNEYPLMKMTLKQSHQALWSHHPGYRSTFPTVLWWCFWNPHRDSQQTTTFLSSHRSWRMLLRERKPVNSFSLVLKQRDFHRLLYFCLLGCCSRGRVACLTKCPVLLKVKNMKVKLRLHKS